MKKVLSEARGKSMLFACVGTMALSATTVAAAAEGSMPASEVCTAFAAKEERAHLMPDALLQALSLAESGRRDDATGRLVTWPWTVMAEGEGRFYPNKESAVAAVKSLRARGVRNIDVGCMQVNLMHHAEAFESIEDALEPRVNVAYGARFLSALQRETGSWFSAVKRYHSAAPRHHLPYRTRVFQIWRNTKRQMLAAAGGPVSATADNATLDNSEAMSATIRFMPVKLSDLPGTYTPQSRDTLWKTAYQKTEAALGEWRRSAVHVEAAPDQHQRALAAERSRAAMEVLARAASR